MFIVVNSPVGVADLDLDVQCILQLAGKSFHDLADSFVGIVAEGDFREAFAVRVTGFSQSFLGAFDIGFFGKIIVTGGIHKFLSVDNVAGGHEGISRISFSLDNIFDDGSAVDSHAEGLADQDVVKRGFGAVEVIPDGTVGRGHYHTGAFGLQAGHIGGRNSGHTVDVAVFISHQAGAQIGNEAEGDLFQVDLVSIIVVRVLDQDEAFTEVDFRHHEWSVGDIGVGGSGPAFAVGGNGSFLDRAEGPHGQNVKPVGSRGDQGQFQGLVIQGFDTDGIETEGIVFIIFRGTGNITEQEINVAGTGVGVQNTLHGVNIILSGVIAAVGPFQAVAQGEGVDGTVIGNRPAFSFARDQGAVFGRIGNQTFKNVVEDRGCEGIVRNSRINTVRLIGQRVGDFLNSGRRRENGGSHDQAQHQQ